MNNIFNSPGGPELPAGCERAPVKSLEIYPAPRLYPGRL